MALTHGPARAASARKVATLLAGTAWASFAAAQPALFAQYRDYSGAELFLQFCAACHGETGRGDGPVAASLAVPVPDLTRLAERRGSAFPAAEVREIIDGRALVVAHGPRYMPVWGYEFWIEEGADIDAEAESREMIGRLVEYLRELQGASTNEVGLTP